MLNYVIEWKDEEGGMYVIDFATKQEWTTEIAYLKDCAGIESINPYIEGDN